MYYYYDMNVDRVSKSLDKETIANGRPKTYTSYDQDLFHKVRRIAGREGTTISGVIHRLFQQLVEEYYDGKRDK